MKRNTKKRMRKQKKYQIRRDVKKQRAEHVVDCLHLPKDVVMGAELTQLSGNSEMQVRNFKKLISCVVIYSIIRTELTKILGLTA